MPDVQIYKLRITVSAEGTTWLTTWDSVTWVCDVPKTSELPAAIYFEISPNADAYIVPEFTPLQCWRAYVDTVNGPYTAPEGSPSIRSAEHQTNITFPREISGTDATGYFDYDMAYSMTFRGNGTVTKADMTRTATTSTPLVFTIIKAPGSPLAEEAFVIDFAITATPRPDKPLP